MTQLQYRAGDVLFREGDPSTFAILIVTGEVEVTREVEGHERSLGTIGSGEWVGEMGVIEDRARIATVRAVDDATAELVAKDEFLRRMSREPELAHEIIVRLSERLSERVREATGKAPEGATAARLELASPTSTEPAKPRFELRLRSDSGPLSGEIPEAGLHVTTFPFAVGRELGDREPPPPWMIDLALEDERPYRLSRQHFCVEETEEGLQLRDLDSYLGTQVDDEPLGTSFGRDTRRLEPGEHLVVAGGTDSPFRFRIAVTRHD